MQRVNFFHERVRGLSYRKMALIAVGILSLLAMAVSVQYGRYWIADRRYVRIQKEIEQIKYKHGLRSVGSVSSANPIEAVTQALVYEPAWAEALQVISQSISEGIWLESISGEAKPEGGELLIQGTAHQIKLVPAFLDRLRSHDIFMEVGLSLIESSGENNADTKRFRALGKTRARKGGP